MKRLLTYLFILLPAAMAAQDDVEYKLELGGAFGLVNYLGDYNSNLFSCSRPMGSVIAKAVLNPHMDIRGDLSVGALGGTYKVKDDYYPEGPMDGEKFSHMLYDLSAVFEYNFWAYGTGKDYFHAKRIAPFIFLGIGATLVTTKQQTVFTGNVPIGVGVKYRAGARLNLALEWAMHFSLSDKLDGVVDPYGIKSSGLFKNTDCYSMLKFTVTYSLLAKCRTCNPEY